MKRPGNALFLLLTAVSLVVSEASHSATAELPPKRISERLQRFLACEGLKNVSFRPPESTPGYMLFRLLRPLEVSGSTIRINVRTGEVEWPHAKHSRCRAPFNAHRAADYR